ncbi:PEP-CTERM sorting domain-containing protein [Sphingomonas sp.]|uniref:PEP-CTERM sorting domain-containing protein n=1 Tax=Sphingomonas sp. TaxID=28214 RepID=UPI00183CF2E6|nr:PEP-CTERM sorting domain-containing protein [Sphingomonas sp.]MBA4762798.1 PEP-CTERM sorting domain-containing protein [Sphingomonas sp.]
MICTSLRLAALAAAFAAAPALAYDKPPSSSTPPGSSSGGGTGSSGGGPTSIPEPAAIGLFALGIAGAAYMRRRKRED